MDSTIREAGADDMPALISMSRKFHAISPWSHLPIDDDRLTETLGGFLASEKVGVFVTSDLSGMIGVMVGPVFFATVSVAQEIAWWCERPGHGSYLLLAAEKWARDNGAVSLQIARLAGINDDMMHRMYERRGYALSEIFYNKAL